MCTLIVLDRITPGYPRGVASHRDEFYSRPAAPPARVDPEQDRPPFVAPQDLEAGGTWMGVNASGLFVGLTNRPVATPRKDKRSRGLLVRDALAHSTPSEVERELGDSLNGYNPFHLLCADGRETRLTVLDPGASGSTRVLEPGVHVVCNRDPEDPGSQKVSRIRDAVQQIELGAGIERVLAGLSGVLAAHPDDSNPLENPCVHTPEYGTRAASLLALGDRWRFWHADGPPCETKYTNLTRLLDGLRPASPRPQLNT